MKQEIIFFGINYSSDVVEKLEKLIEQNYKIDCFSIYKDTCTICITKLKTKNHEKRTKIKSKIK